MVLLPAYGRDYNNIASVTKDWVDGKDFRIAATGQYTSIRDQAPGTHVVLYYHKKDRCIPYRKDK